MTLPLHYKTNRKQTARICPHTRKRGSAVCGGILTLALGIICTLLLIIVSNEVGAEDHLVKRRLQNANIFAQSSSEKEFDITPNSIESPVDLLGGLTGVMSHFRIESTDKPSSVSVQVPRLTSAPVVDPLAALSEAFLEAFDVTDVLQGHVNSQMESLGQRSYPHTIPDSILWANQPSLLSILSDVVGQVCVIDSGAGARLLDAILEAAHVSSTDITSIVHGVTEISSISLTHLLPLILPALAAALGIPVQQPQTGHHQTIDDVMAEIISHGGLFITEIMNSEMYLTSADLYDCMNQLAGLVCAAAAHLKLPICMVSKQVSSTIYQVIIPCDCTGSESPPVTSQNLEGYMPPAAGSTTEWNVVTMPAAAGYSFSSLSPSNMPPKYGKDMPNFTTDASGVSRPAPSNQAYGGQSEAASTSTIPADSKLPEVKESPGAYSEPYQPDTTATCPICSCHNQAPSGYPALPSAFQTKTPSEVIPIQNEQAGNKFESYKVSTTRCASDQPPLPSEPMTIIERPNYSMPMDAPKQTLNPGNKDYKPPAVVFLSSISQHWRYIGCFRDAAERVMQGGGPTGFFRGDVSNKGCMDYCQSNGFTNAGTEDGKECWCGHAVTESLQPLPATACSTPCQGKPADYCGGTWAISIYTRQSKTQIGLKYGTMAELLAFEQTQLETAPAASRNEE